MYKEKKDKHFLKKPIYEGGPKAMKNFIKAHLKYPDEALQAKIEGSVKLRYAIDYKGNVTDVKVISSLGYGCDEEAIRIIKLLTFDVPKTRKMKVLFHKVLTIHFRLPKPQPQTKTTHIQYNITVTKSPEKNAEPKKDEGKGGGYSYTIKY